MKISTVPGIELHSRQCLCSGAGYTSFLRIGHKDLPCKALRVVKLSLPEWKAAGEPRTIEEYESNERNP